MLNNINATGIFSVDGDRSEVMMFGSTIVTCPNCLTDHRIYSNSRIYELFCDDCNTQLVLNTDNLIDLKIPYSD